MRLLDGCGRLLRRHFVVGSECFARGGIYSVECHGSPKGAILPRERPTTADAVRRLPLPIRLFGRAGGLEGGFVRAHDFAGERLRAHARFSQRLDLLPLLVALFHHLSFFRCGLVEQARECAALVLAFCGELPVRGRLLVKVLLQLVDIALMCSPDLGELRVKPVAAFLGALQPGSQILKMSATLLEKLFELVLSRKGALKRFDSGRGFLEGPFDGKHSLASVGRVGVRGAGVVRAR